MASKKGKKNKGKTVPLTDFLQSTAGTIPAIPIRKSTLNWADEVEDNHDLYDARAVKASVVLPTAPKASRDYDDVIDKVPQDPPYIAYLSNLPYDVDENEIEYFFKNMKISNMRIPKDDRPGEVPKLKGFGYVEFEDRDSLLNALLIPDTTIKNRRIRIEVASDYDDKRRSGRMDMNRDRGNRPEVSSGDWRSGPRQQDMPDNNDRRGFSRDRDGFSRDRDDSSSTTSMWREGNDRRNTRGDTDRPFTRSRDDKEDFSRSRNHRGGDDDFRSSRDDRFMSRRYDDRNRGGGGSGGGGGGGFSRRNDDQDREQQAPSSQSEPRQRPKLMLAPRTKPIEAASEPTASASIFGNAKPVDTSARERQIEERLAKAHETPAAVVAAVSTEERESSTERERTKDVKERDRASESDKGSLDRSPQRKSESNGVAEKTQQPKKNGEEKREVSRAAEAVVDKPKPENKKRDDKKERTEKEMPKLKKQDPPNFVASNKFAFLENEDNSD